MNDWILLHGCCLPWDTPRALRHNGTGLQEVICRGAISPRDFDGDDCVFEVDHRRRPSPPGARVSFINKVVGLYCSVLLPPSREARELLAMEARWKGFSIGFEAATATRQVDWQHNREWITRIQFLSSLSLCIDGEPAYPGTWAMRSGGDRKAASMARASDDYHRWRVAIHGPHYKAEAWYQREVEARTHDTGASWVPLQSPRLERLIDAQYPGRAFLRQMGAIRL
jgi:hypothetical protein